MQTYELTIVLPERATSAKKKSQGEMIEKIVKTFKGSVKKMNDWGKIELAYPIKKNTSGNFVHFVLELDGEAAKTLKDKIRLEEGVIRSLLIRKD